MLGILQSRPGLLQHRFVDASQAALALDVIPESSSLLSGHFVVRYDIEAYS